MKNIPFTYLVKFLPTGEVYYGARYSRRAHPSQLWTSYFTSSRTVKRLIEVHGIDSFQCEIRKTFKSTDDARRWETRVLQRMNARNHPRFLNKHNNDTLIALDNSGHKNPMYGTISPMRGKKHTPETLKKMSEANSGERNGFYGKRCSPELKNKLKERHSGANGWKFKGYYHTPHGTFASSREAQLPELSYKVVQKWCKNPEKKVSKGAIVQSPYLRPEHLGKTFKELGFYFSSTGS